MTVNIDSGDWTDAYAPLADSFAVLLADPVIEAKPRDLGPQRPGIEPDCLAVMEAGRQADEELVPLCEMLQATRPHPETQLPCWWAETTELGDGLLRARVETAYSAEIRPVSVTCECSR